MSFSLSERDARRSSQQKHFRMRSLSQRDRAAVCDHLTGSKTRKPQQAFQLAESSSVCPSGTCRLNLRRKLRDTSWSTRRWWQEPRGEVHTHTHSHTDVLMSLAGAVLGFDWLVLLRLLQSWKKPRGRSVRWRRDTGRRTASPTPWSSGTPRSCLTGTPCTSPPLCVCVCAGACLYLMHCVCAGRERGGSESCGGRAFPPASEEEFGASLSATSWTSHQVQTRDPGHSFDTSVKY